MKTLLSYKYNYRKFIADNLQSLLLNKYTEIEDEEYQQLITAVNTYVSTINENEEPEGGNGSENSGSSSNIVNAEVLAEINQLKNEIAAIKPLTFDVEEDGLYFVDEDGNVGAKIVASGFYAINIDTNQSSGNNDVTSLGDLSDVALTNPQTGEALLYYANSSSWKNGTLSGGGVSEITVIDY